LHEIYPDYLKLPEKFRNLNFFTTGENMPTGNRLKRKPNLLLIGIDSLRADHMSCYGYPRQTTPHISQFAKGGAVFEQTYSAYIPTTSGYASMLSGMDVFSTQMVGLRHKGTFAPGVKTLAEVLKENGYNTTCVGFTGNPASRGFDKYLEFSGWGSWETGRSPKAQNLNEVTIPELDILASQDQPFFLFLRHMDPHSPYLAPHPYERMFYHGNELDPSNLSMEPVKTFKPFCDFFASWMPPGITDKDYIIAQYDGAIAYMDACIQTIFTALEERGILDETIVIINSDHGETLYDHDCYFDHHGLYDPTLFVPLIIHYPGKIPAGKRVKGFNLLQDLMPTLMELMEIDPGIQFDGKSLMGMVRGEIPTNQSEFYITECTWMRKNGWRTPEWKLIVALEPDFHFKPPVELYNLIEDPLENNNLAEQEPEVVAMLKERMDRWIAKREKETGNTNPILTQGDWHGYAGVGPFKTSQQAYDTLHIGEVNQAKKIQAEARK
jgi:arylsulfatase A-like enzyme